MGAYVILQLSSLGLVLKLPIFRHDFVGFSDKIIFPPDFVGFGAGIIF